MRFLREKGITKEKGIPYIGGGPIVRTLILIHRFLGESLVTVALIGLLLSLFAKAPGSKARRGSLILGRVFAGLIDLQWLLGVISYFAIPAAARPSLMHPLVMTVMVVAFHIYFRRLQREEPANQWPFVACYLGAWLLIFVGIQVVP